MNKNTLLNGFIGLGLLALNVYASAAGNESILPSAILALALFLVAQIRTAESRRQHLPAERPSGRAAWLAIASFSAFVIVFSLFASYFFLAIAEYFHWTSFFDGDFVRVFINDAHELCYSTVPLLILYAIYTGVLQSRHLATQPV